MNSIKHVFKLLVIGFFCFFILISIAKADAYFGFSLFKSDYSQPSVISATLADDDPCCTGLGAEITNALGQTFPGTLYVIAAEDGLPRPSRVSDIDEKLDMLKFKLGFDRTFWVKEIRDKSQIKTYETAVQSQKAALSVLGPGVKAEDVHAAYADAIQSAGYPYPTFRCGRATGFSMLEEPQLVSGNTTILQPGMVFAVDGSANEETFRAQVGDSFIITENGYDQITNFSKKIEDLII